MDLKVLQVINTLGTGGAERSLAEMLPRFRELGIDVTVVCLHQKQEGMQSSVIHQDFAVRFLQSGSFPTPASRRPPRVSPLASPSATLLHRFLRKLRKERRTLVAAYGAMRNARRGQHAKSTFGVAITRVLALRRLIQQEHPALVHTTIIESNLIGRLAATSTGVPVLTSLVNTSYDAARYNDPNVTAWKLRLVQMIDGWTARHLTEHFHAITHAVKKANARDLKLPPGRVTVIERGRDAERMGRPGPERRQRVREKLGLSESDEVLINVGRQEFQKGQRHLLEAVDKLLSYRTRLKLLVAGRKGHATPELERMMEQSPLLQERVQFLGHRDDVPDLLAAADVFVFPSLYEGLGGAVIEAMALGLPVVASDVPAVREVTEDGRNALLVAPGDVSALAQALGGLLDDPERRAAFGERSRAIYEERFTLDRIVERMVELYHQVAGLRRPAAAHVA